MNGARIESILRKDAKCRRVFLGVFPSDRLPNRFDSPALMVCNTDPHDKPGEHWIVIYVEDGSYGEYFDSFGLPPNAIFRTFLNRHCGNWLFNEKGPSIKYVTLFLAPLPLSHFVTHPGTPRKYVPHLGPPPPIFSRPSTKILDKSPLYKFCLNCSRRFLSRGFCPGWFLSVFLLSQYICYNKKLNITLNFMFHMYDKNLYKRDVTCS